MNLSIISEYRTPLMGFSIILIMLFHGFNGNYDNAITTYIQHLDIGVEFFLILSGIGIYYSLEKNYNLKSFYAKRFLRVVPLYLIISLPYYLRFSVNFSDAIKRWLLIFTPGDLAYWFILALMVCYMFAPFYYRIQKYDRSYLYPIAVFITCLLVSSYFTGQRIIIMRIPIFVLGMEMGKLLKHHNYSINRFIIILTGICCLFLLHFTKRDAFQHYFFLSLPLLYFIGILISKFKFTVKPLYFLGGITLELYLIHERYGIYLCSKFTSNNIVLFFSSVAVSILIAYMVNKKYTSIIGKKSR